MTMSNDPQYNLITDWRHSSNRSNLFQATIIKPNMVISSSSNFLQGKTKTMTSLFFLHGNDAQLLKQKIVGSALKSRSEFRPHLKFVADFAHCYVCQFLLQHLSVFKKKCNFSKWR